MVACTPSTHGSSRPAQLTACLISEYACACGDSARSSAAHALSAALMATVHSRMPHISAYVTAV